MSILLSSLGVLMTATIYFIGAQFSYGYFGWFHINADRFTRDRTQTMLDGIKAIFTFCTDVLGFYDRQWLVLPVVFLTMLATILSYLGLVKLVAWLVRRRRLQSERLTRWGRMLLLLSIWPFATVYFLFALPFLTSLLISLPAAVGERAGRIVAQRVSDEIKRCPHELSGSMSFVQIKEGEVMKAQGFLLAATHDRVALLDRGVPDQGSSRRLYGWRSWCRQFGHASKKER